MDAKELKPCPFCGSSNFRVETGDVQPDNYWDGHVQCTACDAQGPVPDEWLGSKDKAESAARVAWNRRAALPSDAAQAPSSGWQTGTPQVPEGKCREFIIAVRRVQSKPPGNIFVFSASYANNFTDDGCLSGRDGDEFVAQGWYVCGLDMSGEFNEVYEPIGLGDGDEIVGWQELPKWSDAAPVAPAAGVPSDAQPVAWRYLTPTGWHVVEDAGKAARFADYHEVRPLFEAAPASLTPLAAAGLTDTTDAARYRWLARQAVAVRNYASGDPNWEIDWQLRGETFEAAVDAARALLSTTQEDEQ